MQDRRENEGTNGIWDAEGERLIGRRDHVASCHVVSGMMKHKIPDFQHAPHVWWHPQWWCAFIASYTRIVRTCVDDRLFTVTPPYIDALPPLDIARGGSDDGGVLETVANLLKMFGLCEWADVGSSDSSSMCSPGMSWGQLKRFRRQLERAFDKR